MQHPVSNLQVCVAIGVPMLFNAVLLALYARSMNARFDRMESKLDHLTKLFDRMKTW
jgi:hypothetical protein